MLLLLRHTYLPLWLERPSDSYQLLTWYLNSSYSTEETIGLDNNVLVGESLISLFYGQCTKLEFPKLGWGRETQLGRKKIKGSSFSRLSPKCQTAMPTLISFSPRRDGAPFAPGQLPGQCRHGAGDWVLARRLQRSASGHVSCKSDQWQAKKVVSQFSPNTHDNQGRGRYGTFTFVHGKNTQLVFRLWKLEWARK